MNNKLPILYSFRRCPYAIRARLALAYSNQSVILREILLKDKPAEFLELSSKATVPVLQISEKRVLEESLEIMQWGLQHHDPEDWLPQSIQEKSRCDALIQTNDDSFKPVLDRYKYSVGYPEKSESGHRDDAEFFLRELEQQLNGHSYLVADRITLADAAIFPFIRQFYGVNPKWFDQAPYPKLQRWLNEWLESELFLSVMHKYPQWHAGDPPTCFPNNH